MTAPELVHRAERPFTVRYSRRVTMREGAAQVQEHDGGIRTYHVGCGVVAADGSGWLPGCYDSHETALRAALTLTVEQMTALGWVYQVDGENRQVTNGDIDSMLGGAVVTCRRGIPYWRGLAAGACVGLPATLLMWWIDRVAA